MHELSNWGFMGFGICCGFMLGLYYYDILMVKLQKAKIKAAIAGFNDALAALGISKDKDGEWQMKPEDRDEVWVKKQN